MKDLFDFQRHETGQLATLANCCNRLDPSKCHTPSEPPKCATPEVNEVPHFYLKSSTVSTCTYTPSHKPKLLPSILSPCPKKISTLANKNMVDELSNLYLALSRTIQNNRAPASRDWSLSCLARVITNRMVIDDNFIRQMLNLWSVTPGTRIAHITNRTYLINFVSQQDMYEKCFAKNLGSIISPLFP